ncbi:MAG: hypothetical protein JSS10_02960 [Verrucomicrobia bacterium]|nr:hypothetical protein [Verrucomicrobiota bacterium]
MTAIGNSSFLDSLNNTPIPVSFRVDKCEKKGHFRPDVSGEGMIQKHQEEEGYIIISCGTVESFMLSPAELQSLYKSSRVQQKICTRRGEPEQVREFHFSEGKFLILDFTLNPVFSFKYEFLNITRYTITARS